MNIFARFDENPAMTLQVIKKTKRLRTDGRTDAHTDARTHARTDNVKTVYPTTNKVCGGYNKGLHFRSLAFNVAVPFNLSVFADQKKYNSILVHCHFSD